MGAGQIFGLGLFRCSPGVVRARRSGGCKRAFKGQDGSVAARLRKTREQRASGAGSSGRAAAGRRRAPTPCSPSNAASTTTDGLTSSIGGPAAPQPPGPKIWPAPQPPCAETLQRLNAFPSQGCSSAGRASVSKTEGRGFEPLRPCQIRDAHRISRLSGLPVAVRRLPSDVVLRNLRKFLTFGIGETKVMILASPKLTGFKSSGYT